MDKLVIVLLVVLIVGTGLVLWGKNKSARTEKFVGENSPYLGQRAPGLNPEIFAPGIISTKSFEFAITFSPDGKEIFFSRRPGPQPKGNALMYMKRTDQGWTEPKPAPFSLPRFAEFEPNITPDGKRIFFMSNRKTGKFAVWMSEKTGDEWGVPQLAPSPINDDFAMYVTATAKGSIYFTGKGGIYKSRFVDGKYSKPSQMGININYLNGAHPYIAPDESYLIFDAKGPKPEDKPSLYISFKKEDGSWSKAKSMGDKINTHEQENCPQVSPDGKYFFFHRNGNIFWVDSKIIQDLK